MDEPKRADPPKELRELTAGALGRDATLFTGVAPGCSPLRRGFPDLISSSSAEAVIGRARLPSSWM